MLSTQLIIPYYPVILCHRRSTSFSRNLPPLFSEAVALCWYKSHLLSLFFYHSAWITSVTHYTCSVHYIIISLLTTLQLQMPHFKSNISSMKFLGVNLNRKFYIKKHNNEPFFTYHILTLIYLHNCRNIL